MKLLIVILTFIISVGTAIFVYTKSNSKDVPVEGKEIRYIPLGDSYTIGEGVWSSESWPQLLTNHLRESGYNVRLVSNPAKSGWTVQDVIDYELPIFIESKPDFATLLIGANDHAQGIDEGRFRDRLSTLINRMVGVLPDKKNLILITIPDYSVTPRGKLYGDQKAVSDSISRFNDIIKEEAKKRELPVVDIFPLTQKMGEDPTLIHTDGLHPSAQEYIRWENEIYPAVLKILKK